MRNVESPQKVIGIVTKKPDIADIFSASLNKRNFASVVYKSTKELHEAMEKGYSPDGLILSARNAPELSQEALKIPRIEAVKGEIEKAERRVITTILNQGAWSYIATENEKPQDVADFAAAKMNRIFNPENKQTAQSPIEIGNIAVDPERRYLEIDNKPTNCPPIAFEVLALLMSSPNVVFTKKEIANHLTKEGVPTAYLNQHLRTLRIILGPIKRDHVERVRGIGLRFTTNPDEYKA